MAKTQTFSDKLKKKKGDGLISIKVIKGYRSEIGSTRFLEKFVKIESADQIEKLDISK